MTDYTTHHFEAASRYTVSVGYDRRLYEHDIDGSVAHARMLGRQGIIAQPTRRHRRGIGCRAPRDRRRRVPLARGARRPPHEHRDAPARAHRRAVPRAPHRTLPQRPGRDCHPPLRPRRHRPRHEGCCTACRARSLTLAEREQDALLPGYTHLQRAQPRAVRAPHARLLRDVRPRRRPPRRRSRRRANVEAPARLWRARGRPVPPRLREWVARETRLRRHLRELDGRRLRPRLRRRVPRCRRDVHDALLAPRGGDRAPLDVAGVRLPATRRGSGSQGSSIMPQKRNPDFARDRARQDGPRLRQPRRPAHHAQGPPAHLQP